MFARTLTHSRGLTANQCRAFAIKVGDAIPSAKVSVVKFANDSFSSEIVDTKDYFANKKIVLVGYPGAFTPTCMATHIPEYIANAQEIKQKGTDEIIAMSVNDPFVVSAFADKLGGKHLVNYMADGNGDFTKALGLDFDLQAVQLGPIRTKRMSMTIVNGKVTNFNNEDGPALTETSACSTVLKQL